MTRRYLFAAVIGACFATVAVAEDFPVRIEVDARTPGAELTPIWRFFGADEPNYATMKDGRALLALSYLGVIVHVASVATPCQSKPRGSRKAQANP